MPVQPFLDINLWHDFSTGTAVVFNDRAVTIPLGGTSLEFGGGFAAQVSSKVSAYGALHVAVGLNGGDDRSVGGSVGLRVRW